MNTRKNIDKLYLRKFEGAEIEPPEDVWINIASRLPEGKQKRRIIPLWFRFTGAAAIILLLVNLGFEFFSTPTNTQVVGTPVTRQDIHKEIRLSSTEFTETMLQVSMTLQEIMQREQSINVSSATNAASAEGISFVLEESVGKTKVNGASEEQVGMTLENMIAGPSGSGSSIEEGPIIAGNTGKISSDKFTDTKQNFPVGGEEGSQLGKQAEILKDEVSEENAIAQQVAAEFTRSKEDAVDAAGGKISISTRVAPVFYENIGKGNTMGASMEGSKASGEVSFSYGINLAYQVSDRFKIRSGINKLDLSFSTPGVPMATAMNSEPLFGEKDPALMSRPVEGDLQQQMDFIEVPIEVEYRLLDKRVGLNLIAGGSSLFLNSNNLSMDTGIRTTDLGQAENMEEVNFSANLGMGLDYQLTPSFRLSLEPMFKYQLNSFSKDTGMRPYYMAIYSGFSFSF